MIAAWRRTIIAAGGITASTQPLLRRLTSRAPLENEWKPKSRNHKDGAGAANLHSLLAACGAVGARRELRMRDDSSFYASSVVSSSSASSNSISLSKTWPPSSTSPQGAVEVDVRLRPLQQPFVFEPFDVGKVAQCREPKNLQEFFRRDIGEGRAGFGRAHGPVDEIETLQTADDVAADFLAGEPRNFRTGGGLQISNRRHRQKFGRRQFGKARGASLASIRRADRGGKARFGAQLIAAGDKYEVVGPCAKFVDDVGDEIVEFATLSDEFRQRFAGHGIARGEDRRLDATHPFAPACAARNIGEVSIEQRILFAFFGTAHR